MALELNVPQVQADGKILKSVVPALSPDDLNGFDERVRDAIGAALRAVGLTVSVDDAGDTITLTAPELVAGTGIAITAPSAGQVKIDATGGGGAAAPSKAWQPADSGYLAWSVDPGVINNQSTAPSTGTLVMVKVKCPDGGSFNTIDVYVGTAGSAVSAAAFSVYNAATKAKIGTTATVSDPTIFHSTGGKTVSLGQTITVPGDFYIGFTFEGTTAPALNRAGTGFASINLPSTAYRAGYAGAATASTHPATATIANTAQNLWWVGVRTV